MNKKEAEEVIKKPIGDRWLQAASFLEGYAEAEKKAEVLVEIISKAVKCFESYEEEFNGWYPLAKKVLAQYQSDKEVGKYV